jgi:RimJ/RimL family protein N-acetyltransferase
MRRMIKRWLRRRLGAYAPLQEDDLDDEDRERGSLVRKGRLVSLRTHVPANREAFQRWYGDPEVASLLRHDLEPLTEIQSRGYFDTFILPSSARGVCFAIHERGTRRLIGTTALTDRETRKDGASALFRIVIGEKDTWGQGYGTEATRLVMEEGFESLGLSEVRLEVFGHNERAIAAYRKVGFDVTGEHVEWVPRRKTELRVIEMRLAREAFASSGRQRATARAERSSVERQRRRVERVARRSARQAERTQTKTEHPLEPPLETTPANSTETQPEAD